MSTEPYYDPWAVIRAHPQWTLSTWHELPDGERGRWYHHFKVMLIDRRLGQRARRSVAAHEVEHALGGDAHCDEKVHERRRREAARKLIRYCDLESAVLFHGHDLHAVAEELHVTDADLRLRLRTLHPAERHALRRALDERGEVA